MDRRTPNQRWEDLADAVARVAEGATSTDLPTVVARLESAAGVDSFTGRDPDVWVTTRRFARAYAAAIRSGRYRDGDVLQIVDEGIAQLTGATMPTRATSPTSPTAPTTATAPTTPATAQAARGASTRPPSSVAVR